MSHETSAGARTEANSGASIGAKPRAWMSWSSGKDSAWALHEALRAGDLDVVGLVTTINESADRVAVHAVRNQLLDAQAASLGLPLVKVPLPSPCPNVEYEKRMGEAVERAKADGVTHMIFGDLYLQDIRAYREKLLEGTGIVPVFPLWERNTLALARVMIEAGLVAHLSAVDPKRVPADWAGRRWDLDLLDELPEGVDPCGENGEWHTFVSAGPMLRQSIPIRKGTPHEKNGFVYCDFFPAYN